MPHRMLFAACPALKRGRRRNIRYATYPGLRPGLFKFRPFGPLGHDPQPFTEKNTLRRPQITIHPPAPTSSSKLHHLQQVTRAAAIHGASFQPPLRRPRPVGHGKTPQGRPVQSQVGRHVARTLQHRSPKQSGRHNIR